MASIVRSDLATAPECSLEQTYCLASQEGPAKLFCLKDNVFHVNFTESGTAYGEKSETSATVTYEISLSNDGRKAMAGYELVQKPVEMWGINFPGSLVVGSSGGYSGTIYLPGVRMYDPTGRTGDPHASERVGPSCAKFQTCVTIIELAAAQHGATLQQLQELHEQFRAVVERYHGRLGLFDWMFQQVQDVVYSQKAVTPFSEFTQSLFDVGKLSTTNPGSDHSLQYLKKGVAPAAYFRKVKAKDDVDSVVAQENKAKFDSYLA